jgi:pimeloyl-ACP methyl ester carboxylesterase
MSRKKHRSRLTAISFLAGGVAYLGGSYFAARRLTDRLLSPSGLTPGAVRRPDLLAALHSSGATVADYRHAGSPRAPASLAAIFASPSGGEPSGRATILFLHGKGGASAEWQPDALRALGAGYNVLLPDLRGHRPSEGEFVTYGYLEKDDLAAALEAARERFGLDLSRLGVHACSAGSTVALEFAAGRPSIRALWLESPYADPREMARHYLSITTRLPRWTLGLTSRWAVQRAVTRVRRELHLTDPRAGLGKIDPVRAVSRVTGKICLVHGLADRLVPPRFAARLEAALPADAIVWKVTGAGHCHHADEAEKVVEKEYVDRWVRFFQENLPAERV